MRALGVGITRKQTIQSFDQFLRRPLQMHTRSFCVNAAQEHVHRTTHVLEGTPRPALQTRVMQGMLTGSMDLVLQHDGRYWVVDYKSNKLPSYDPNSLQDAVLHKRYDVQYVLYTLALHRLLKVRLPDYDYAKHIGGAVYLFLRGIDQAGAGVHAHKPPQALIETLDALFALKSNG